MVRRPSTGVREGYFNDIHINVVAAPGTPFNWIAENDF